MKTGILVILLFFNVSFISQCIGQYNALKFDLLGTLGARFNISYERSLNRHFSAGVEVEYLTPFYSTHYLNGELVYQIYGYGIIPEARYYPLNKNKPAPLGLFLGGTFRFAAMEEAYLVKDVYTKGTSYSLGLSTGYKFNYRKVLFELLIGYSRGFITGYENGQLNTYGDHYQSIHNFNMRLTKEYPRLEISIGYVFPKIIKEKAKKNNS